MFITTAQTRMKLNDSGDDFILDMYTDSTNYYFSNRNVMPTETEYIKATESINEMTGLVFNVEQIKDLLSLYPHSRISLAINGTSGCPDDLSFAISHFLLGCAWPTYGDNIDINKFVLLLQSQAKKVFPDITVNNND